MTENQWRFLKAIAERVPEDRIVEVRLFPTIRQGGAESGVAVVAVEEIAAGSAAAEAAADAGSGQAQAAVSSLEFPGAATTAVEAAGDVAEESATAERGAPPETDDITDDASDRHQFISTQVDSTRGVADQAPLQAHREMIADWLHQPSTSELEIPHPRADVERHVARSMADLPETEPTRAVIESPRLREASPAPFADSPSVAEHEVAFSIGLDNGDFEAPEEEPTPSLDDILDLAAASAATASVAKAARMEVKRYAVLAARYRLTLKGPDRGKWDFEITHEADAPLDTIDRVARGVARRAGDAGDPESLTAPQLRSTLSQPWWTTAP